MESESKVKNKKIKIELSEEVVERLRSFANRKVDGCRWVLENKRLNEKKRERIRLAMMFWLSVLRAVEESMKE
jgi:hypothetical protein